ncbi:nose resistant to fluoxetine protein 6-like [Mytilus galloprovincialis]|uniref:nose resistant to fluoxetine protein 6-like n=1 Tax=Mytilus galloprovincialis TaxID=29158 RepID=UPI003F7C47E9
MNLSVFICFVLFTFEVYSLNQNQGYIDNFLHVNKLFQEQKYNIKKSPLKYAQMAESIGKATDLRTVFSLRKELSAQSSVMADNVTEIPGLVSTSSNKEPTKPPEPDISELCKIHANGIIEGINQQQFWALRMLDSAGKPPANLLGGGFKWLGDYEECLDIEGQTVANNLTYSFGTQYCMVTVVNIQALPPILPLYTPLNIGMCMPNSCTVNDTQRLIDIAVKNVTNNLFIAYQAECQEPDRPYDTRAVIVLVVISFFITIMTAGTAYDITLIQWPKWQQAAKQKGPDAIVAVEANEKIPLLTDSDQIVQYQPGIFGKILLAFSVYTNGSKLLSTHQPEGSLTAINGIRFISMTWVILGHSYIFVLFDVDNVGTFLPEMMKRVTFPAVSNALVSVDTFFVLSGLLLTYLVMKEMAKKRGKLNWGMFYFHRFWRLTPPYMLVLMVYVSLFPYTGSGPEWKKDGNEYNYCKTSWYYNLLYINNFFEKPADSCFAWAWYLANDMQFFVLSPLIIIPLYFFQLAGFAVLLAFLIGTWVTTGVMATTWNVPMSMFDGGDMTHWGELYFRPYFRMGPYLVGMFTGYLLYKTDLKLKINKFVNLFGWLVAAVLACAVLYGIYDDVNGNRPSQEVSSFYITVHRTVWGAAVSWVIFACAHGYGGYVNTVLSWKGFIPLSRLTYCAYLVHPPIIYYYLLTRRRLIHFTDTEIIYEFLGHLALSYAAAFITSMAFEAPMMGLEKVIFKRQEKTKK